VFDPAGFSDAVDPAAWAEPTSAIVHAFHQAHWGDWKFAVSAVNAANSTMMFSRGGFQEARGSCGRGGHEWFVEGVKELVDQPNEWHYDEATSELFYFFNGTVSPASTNFVASRIATLISLTGTGANPVKDVTISNLTFAHTSPTFMDAYEVPSAGDWSIHRGGAVFATGTDNLKVASNYFRQVGGNGVCISEYSRSAQVDGNRFSRIGDTAVIVAGATNYYSPQPWVHTDGNYPINTMVRGNLASEVGVFTKQTAFFFQSLSWNTTVSGNVAFNGPRSGINMNDNAFGGNIVANNLLFNLVRETVDHGPFNTWDRLPFVTPAVDAANPSTDAVTSHVDSNFFICNYGAVKGIDHDDGSGWYNDRNNFMPLCSGKMKGQTQRLSGNIYLYPSWGSNCVHILPGMATPPFVFENNTCVDNKATIYSGCSTPADATIRNNKYFVPGGSTPSHIKGFPCDGGNWSAWQHTQDQGSTISGEFPSVATMVGWGRDLLEIPG